MWREFASSYPFPVCKGYQYIIDGDTSISGKDYHKIQISGVYYGVDPLGSCALNSILSSFNNYSGCFREDIK
jgi:hypothetical protein